MRKTLLVFVFSGSLFLSYLVPVFSQSPDPALVVLQDENFFLQDEMKKVKGALSQKEADLQRLEQEKEALARQLGDARRDTDGLERRAEDLQTDLARTERAMSERTCGALEPLQRKIDDYAAEIKTLQLTIKEKNAKMRS